MVRNYKRKSQQQSYDNVSLENAVKAVRDGTLSSFAASNHFGIPRTTLRRHVKGNVKPVGTRPLFSTAQEQLLVDRITYLGKRGFPMTLENVCEMAFQFAKRLHRRKQLDRSLPTNWDDQKKATYDWFQGFRLRHSEIVLRVPEGLSAARAQAFNAIRIGTFFEEYTKLITELDLVNYPNLIYNADETALMTVASSSRKVVVSKGQRTVSSLKAAERGTLTTFVPCSNALGSMIPPFLIFKGQAPPSPANFPNGSRIICSKSGWMDQFIFPSFLEHFQANRVHIPDKKCVLVLDGHKSHVSDSAVEYALNHDIELVCIPPHSTHRLQPIDTHFNRPLKQLWSREISRYLMESDVVLLNKQNFHNVFCPVWENMITRRSLFVDGFSYCGLYPPKNPTTASDFQISSSFTPSGDSGKSSEIPTSSNFASTSGLVLGNALRRVSPSPKKQVNPVGDYIFTFLSNFHLMHYRFI
jgi:hypothetical protein